MPGNKKFCYDFFSSDEKGLSDSNFHGDDVTLAEHFSVSCFHMPFFFPSFLLPFLNFNLTIGMSSLLVASWRVNGEVRKK